MTGIVLRLYLTVPWVYQQCVTVAIPGHDHVLYIYTSRSYKYYYQNVSLYDQKIPQSHTVNNPMATRGRATHYL